MMNQGQDSYELSPVMEKFLEDKEVPTVLDVDEVSIRSLAVQDPVLTTRGLTFDEGTCMGPFPGLRLLSPLIRYCWWYGPPHGRIQLHYAHVSPWCLDWLVIRPFIDSETSVGSIIGTGIFSTPSSILGSVGSVGASLMLWVLGFVLASSGLLVWLEYGTMFPRSGGEKVYLEEVYKKPPYLATAIFATHVLLLGFTASGCIVSSCRYATVRS